MKSRTGTIGGPAGILRPALIAVICATFCHAQSAEAPLIERQQEAIAAERRLPPPTAERTITFDLSASRQERLRKFLPKSWKILSQREPFHVLVIGDSALQLAADPEEHGNPALRAFPAMFARELATQFYYTGGIREAGSLELSAGVLAPTITIRQVTRPGGTALDGARILATAGPQAAADLLIVCYGNDDAATMSPDRFASAIEETLDSARAMNLEVILCSPFPAMAERLERTLGLSRPFASVLRRIANDESVALIDLGDVRGLIEVASNGEDEAQVFDAINRAYRAFFREEAPGVFVPRSSLHAKLGQLMFEDLLDAPPAAPWSITAATATFQSSDRLTMRYQIENRGDEKRAFMIYPLIAGGWKPMSANPSGALVPGARQTLEVEYVSVGGDGSSGQEASLCLPLLVAAGGVVRIEDPRATIQPVAIDWDAETFFNHEGPISPVCQLVNTGKETVAGTWQVEFSGKKVDGKFDLKPESTLPLDLKFDLPAEVPLRQLLPLTLVVRCKGIELTTKRHVEITRNLGLNQAMPLVSADTADKGAAGVALTAEADGGMLFLIAELNSPDALLDEPPSGPAWQLIANFDARSYGKRLNRGTTASLRVTGSAADGPGVVQPIAPWAFGNDYSASFDAKEIKATLSSTSGGTRKITMAVPRSYFYLHEWALDNGNSQVGINLHLTLHHQGQTSTPTYRTFSLSGNTKPADDVDSLAVLELTQKPTKRVTVNIY